MKIVSSFLLLFSSLYGMDTIDPDLLDLEEGKSLYEQTCISCHGAKGDASTVMHLVVKPRDLTKSILNQQQIGKIIRKGSLAYGSKADIMPSFGTVFNDEQIANVTYYVYETFVKPHGHYKNTLKKQIDLDTIPVDMNKGSKVFTQTCSMCHGINGNGDGEYVKISKKDEKFIYPYNLQKILLNETQIFLYAKYGGKYWGTEQDSMPAWHSKYNDTELKSVAHYISETIKKRK